MFVSVKNSLQIPWALKNSNISEKIFVKLTKGGHKVIRVIDNNKLLWTDIDLNK